MQDNDTICISRNNAIVIGLVILVIALAVVANFIGSQRLSDRSRASGTDLESLPLTSYGDKVKQMTAACNDVKGYLGRTTVDAQNGVQFDRFSGHYYSLDKTNPAVTPLPGKPESAYCSLQGNPGPNWCAGITVESACRADCAWTVVGTCAKCAPKGADPKVICRP